MIPVLYIPTIVTLLNALFGFFAIIAALYGDIILAAACLLCAVVCDACDGRVARFFNVTSAFGGELDSLADAVSFCLTPPVILAAWQPGLVSPIGMIVLSMYLVCGLLRLAKFNITSVAQSRYFQGLPTPIGALIVASMCIRLSSEMFLLSLLYVLVLSIAFLMVSNVPFPTFKQFRGLSALLAAAVVLTLVYSPGIYLLVALIGFYFAAGIYTYFSKKLS